MGLSPLRKVVGVILPLYTNLPICKQYPTLLALIGDMSLVDKYSGGSFDLEKKTSTATGGGGGGDRKKKKQRAG